MSASSKGKHSVLPRDKTPFNPRDTRTFQLFAKTKLLSFDKENKISLLEVNKISLSKHKTYPIIIVMEPVAYLTCC